MVTLYIILAINLVIVTADLVFNIIKSNRTPAALPTASNIDDVEYSDRTLEFIREYCVQVSVLKYREFIDGHELDKITRTQLQNLVTATVKFINESIVRDHINFDRMLYTSEFVDNYIIHTVMSTSKNLLAKSVDNYNKGE